MKRFIIIAITVFINGAFAFAQKADTLFTLQQCLDIAIKNNLQIKQSSVQMELNKIYWQQARQNMLPTLNGNINHSVSDGRSLNPFTNGYLNQQITSANYGLSSSLILSNGLVLQNSIRQTALAYQAGQMDFQQAKDNLTLNLITAYLQVLSNEDQLTQAVTQINVTQGQVDRFDILNKEGAVQPANLYDLKGSLANSQLALVSAKNALANAKLTLLQLMNLPYTGTFEVQRTLADQLPTPYTETFEQIYNKALSDLAYIKAATLRRESAEKE